jgi:hypothetical protein
MDRRAMPMLRRSRRPRTAPTPMPAFAAVLRTPGGELGCWGGRLVCWTKVEVEPSDGAGVKGTPIRLVRDVAYAGGKFGRSEAAQATLRPPSLAIAEVKVVTLVSVVKDANMVCPEDTKIRLVRKYAIIGEIVVIKRLSDVTSCIKVTLSAVTGAKTFTGVVIVCKHSPVKALHN